MYHPQYLPDMASIEETFTASLPQSVSDHTAMNGPSEHDLMSMLGKKREIQLFQRSYSHPCSKGDIRTTCRILDDVLKRQTPE